MTMEFKRLDAAVDDYYYRQDNYVDQYDDAQDQSDHPPVFHTVYDKSGCSTYL